jgi:hypothetical protein
MEVNIMTKLRKPGATVGIACSLALLVYILTIPASSAQVRHPAFCQSVKYCSIGCGELFRICHNPVQRVTCSLAHVLCAVRFW